MSHNINRLKLTIPISPALTPNDVANIITSVEHLALNRQLIRADEIELTIMGAQEGAATQEEINALGARIKETKDKVTKFDESISKDIPKTA